MPEYLFSREEAERLLPRLIPALERLRQLAEQLEVYQWELAQLQVRARGNGRDSVYDEVDRKRAESEQIRARIQHEVRGIHELGVEVKDLRLGLVDFPSLREGRVVYLCWKLGEAGIGFWHELDTGYAGRQPLDE